jgi:hypothetical protein
VALESAYQRALKIKAIEDKHFGGQKISPAAVGGKSVYDYFQSNYSLFVEEHSISKIYC